jgi:hypothetical protein
MAYEMNFWFRALKYLARAAVALLASCAAFAESDLSGLPALKTASRHPVQYYLSLPKGWSSQKQWPVLLAIDASYGDFYANVERFSRARKNGPFIIVVPFLTDGRSVSASERNTKFHYSPEVWRQIDKESPLAFDLAALDAILAEVRSQYGGEEKPFLTGWGQGGGPITWTLVLTQPERWRGVALACPYFQAEDTIKVSDRPERVDLPVTVFQGESDFLRVNAGLDAQWEKAKKLAEAHGYRNLSRVLVPEKFHDPLADEVVQFFNSRL